MPALPTTAFIHAMGCRIAATDRDYQPAWNQSKDDAQLYERRCSCSFEFWRAPIEERRPPRPDASQHRHGGNVLCPVEAVQFTWDSGSWTSFCGRCSSWTHYLAAADVDLTGMANWTPAPVEFTVPDFAKLEQRARARRRAAMRAELGLPEEVDDSVVA